MLPSENVLRKRKICCLLALATRRQMQQDHEMRALLMVHLFQLSWKVTIGIVNVPSVSWEHLLTHWFGRHWHWHSLEALKKPRIFWRRGDCKVRSYSNPCEPSCWIGSCSFCLSFAYGFVECLKCEEKLRSFRRSKDKRGEGRVSEPKDHQLAASRYDSVAGPSVMNILKIELSQLV